MMRDPNAKTITNAALVDEMRASACDHECPCERCKAAFARAETYEDTSAVDCHRCWDVKQGRISACPNHLGEVVALYRSTQRELAEAQEALATLRAQYDRHIARHIEEKRELRAGSDQRRAFAAGYKAHMFKKDGDYGGIDGAYEAWSAPSKSVAREKP